MTKHRVYPLVCLTVAILAAPAATSAQTVGFGPKISQVRGDVPEIDTPVLDSVNVSHRGSMWSGGLAFYF